MILKPFKARCTRYDPVISAGYRMLERLIAQEEESFFNKKVDDESNGRIVKKQLRCMISSCFDKYNICCKVCDIKKCRYKCNFMDKEECEHQKWD